MQTDIYRFSRIGSYLGCIEFEVWGDESPYRITVRQSAGDYERSIFNGDEQEWRRDVLDAVGLAYRAGDPEAHIAPEVIAAFNTWRAREHAGFIQQLRSAPERYGLIEDGDPILAVPPTIKGAYYVVNTGWVRTS